MRVSRREQWFLFSLGMLVLLFIFKSYLLDAQFKKISELKSEIRSSQASLETLLREEQQYRNIQVKSPQKIRRLSKEELSVSVINYVANNITALNLNLVSMKPNYTTILIKQANLMKFDLKVEGTYNQIYKFINALEQSSDPIAIELFKISRKSGDIATASILFLAYF